MTATKKLRNEGPLRAAIYARLSVLGDTPLDRQESDALALVKRNGYRLVETIRENESAWKEDVVRDGYFRLVELVEAGEVDVVVAYADDRLWRQNLDLSLFAPLARKGGLSHVEFTTNGRRFDPTDADDSFAQTVLTAVAQKSSSDTSRRVKRAMSSVAAAGKPGGGRRPFGFAENRVDHDEREAAAIRDGVRRLLARDVSLPGLVNEWNAADLHTTNGNPWQTQTLGRMLVAPRLAGLRSHNGEVVADAVWSPILDRSTYDRLVAFVDGKRMGPRSSTGARYLLSGIARCKLCGAKLAAQPASKRGGQSFSAEYRCPAKAMGGCGRISANMGMVDAVVTDRLYDVVESDEFAAALASREAQESTVDTDKLVRDLDVDRLSIDELREDYYSRKAMPRSTFLRIEAEIAERIATNEKRLSSLDPAAADARSTLRSVESIRKTFDSMPVDEKRAIVLAILDGFGRRIVVGPATNRGSRAPDPDRVRFEPIGGES